MSDEASDLVNTFNYDKLDEFYASVEEKIGSIKNDGAQAMLYIHWGTEYQKGPNDFQKRLQRRCVIWELIFLSVAIPYYSTA